MRIDLLKESLIGLTTPTEAGVDETLVVDTIRFAQILFQIAEKEGCLECRMESDKELRFTIGESKSFVYAAPFPIFRPILAAVAVWVCSQNGDFSSFEAFNVYGDSKTIQLTKGETRGKFRVETENSSGLSNFLRILKLT